MAMGQQGYKGFRNVPDVAKHEATYGGDDTEPNGPESDLLLGSEVNLILCLGLRRSRLFREETHFCDRIVVFISSSLSSVVRDLGWVENSG